jgi:hypothetical protein
MPLNYKAITSVMILGRWSLLLVLTDKDFWEVYGANLNGSSCKFSSLSRDDAYDFRNLACMRNTKASPHQTHLDEGLGQIILQAAGRLGTLEDYGMHLLPGREIVYTRFPSLLEPAVRQ